MFQDLQFLVMFRNTGGEEITLKVTIGKNL